MIVLSLPFSFNIITTYSLVLFLLVYFIQKKTDRKTKLISLPGKNFSPRLKTFSFLRTLISSLARPECFPALSTSKTCFNVGKERFRQLTTLCLIERHQTRIGFKWFCLSQFTIAANQHFVRLISHSTSLEIRIRTIIAGLKHKNVMKFGYVSRHHSKIF